MAETPEKSPFRMSFRYRLFLIFTLLTAFVTIAFSAFYIISEIRETRAYMRETLRLKAENLANLVKLPLYAGDREALRDYAREAGRGPGIRSVVIRQPNGQIVAEYHAGQPVDDSRIIAETVDVRAARQGISVESALSGSPEGEPHIIGSVSLERGTSDISAMLRRMILVTSCVAAGFWLLVMELCNLVLRKVTRSFTALMKGVERMREGDFNTEIPVATDDEPGRAAVAINELARSLAAHEVENSRLTAELKDIAREQARNAEKLAAMNHTLRQEMAERLQVEQMVRESERNLRRLVDAMPIGVTMASRDGVIEYINDFIVERTGYSRDELLTADEWYERLLPDPDYRARIAALRNEALICAEKGLETPSYEARVTCRDGMVRHALFKHQFNQQRRITIIVDITERELFQEQLIKTQKLESLGILAGGIAHNFNNILTGVLGYISFARMFLDEGHKSYDALGHAEAASHRAAAMANQLLTFAKGGNPVKQPISISRLLRESVELCLNGKNAQPVVQIPDTLHGVMADVGQLNQAFTNILINAVQAMPAGGTVTVRAENVSTPPPGSSSPARRDFVRISISDQGEGIPETIIGKIFDPYFTTKPTGTGLGLASVHSIIQKHDGVITVDSTVGKGTTFIICLPSVGELSAEDGEPARRLSPGCVRKERVLIMDDEDVVREFARDSLEFLGYRVSACCDGQQAVDQYRAARGSNEPFWAVILDLSVPDGMGGMDAARLILEDDPDALLIVSSGYSFDPIMSEFGAYGFRSAISKPYKVDQLSRELEALRQTSSPEIRENRDGIEQKILASGVARW